MAEKAKKNSKNNTNMIIGICAAVAVIVVIVVIAVILATRGGVNGGISDAYFKSDDTKYVLTIESEESTTEDGVPIPAKTHLVYTYSGDQITGLKAYYEYNDAETAKQAYEYYQGAEEGTYANITLDGKYVILTANASEYESLTASDVKQQIEFMELLQNMSPEELKAIENTATDSANNDSTSTTSGNAE